MIDLTNAELFRDLTNLECKESFFDLHNDYVCTDIDYQLVNRSIGFLFKQLIPGSVKKELCLRFEEAIIANFNVTLKRTADNNTLDLFYRGRYEINGNLFEFHPNGEGIFYLDFWEGDSFTIFSKKVTLSF